MDQFKKYSLIPRTESLKLIIDQFDNLDKLAHSSIIEIFGPAGIGKTEILNQIPHFLKYQSIFPQVIKISAFQNINLIQELEMYAEKNGILPTLNKDILDKPITHLNQILLKLFDVKKDLLILIIDDSHFLPKSILDVLIDKYRKKNEHIIILLSGREQLLKANSIQIKPFSEEELKEYYENLFYKDWMVQNKKVVDWISNSTQNIPFHISLLLKDCIKKGLIGKNYVNPFNLFKDYDFPDTIVQAIGSHYKVENLNSNCRAVLEYLIVLDKEKTIKEIQNFGLEFSEKDLQELIEKNWIKKINSDIQLYHPLIKEILLKKITSKHLNKLLKNIIENDKSISTEEKVNLILKLGKIPQKYNSILIDYAEILENSPEKYSAYLLLKRIHPKTTEIHYKIGRLQYHLNKYEDAIKTTIPILKEKEFKNLQKTYINVAESHFLLGKFTEGIQYYEDALQEKFTKDEIYQLKAYLVVKYIQVGNTEKVDQLLNELKSEMNYSTNTKIEYLNAVNIINTVMPLDIDPIESCNEGIKLAEKIDDDDFKARFKTYQMVYYKKINILDKVIQISTENIEYAKNNMFPSFEVNARLNRGNALAYNQKYIPAIREYEIGCELYERLNTYRNYYSSKLNIGVWSYYLGKVKNANPVIQHVLDNIEKIPEILRGQTKVVLGSYYFSENKIEIAENFLNEAVESGQKFNYIDEVMRAKYLLSFIKFSTDRKEADRLYNESFTYLKKQQKAHNLKEAYKQRAVLLSESGETDEIKLILDEWQGDKQSLQYLSVQIRYNILTGNINAGLNQFTELENQFDGQYLQILLELYNWLKTQKQLSQNQIERFTNLEDLIFGIIHEDSSKKIKYNISEYSAFYKLIYEWYISIQTKEFLLDVIEDFTNNIEKQDSLKEVIEFWDIQIVDEYSPTVSSGIPIIINLLGQPELYIGNRKLTIEDYKSRKTIEILAYIILNGYQYKTSVEKDTILDDLFFPEPNEREQKNKYKNITIHRLKKTFETVTKDLIIQQENKIGFNWDLQLYRLDIDGFTSYYENGMKLFQKGELQKAKIEFENAIANYRGYLCEKIEGHWIESIRGTFHQQFLKASENLMSIYEIDGENIKLKRLKDKIILF